MPEVWAKMSKPVKQLQDVLVLETPVFGEMICNRLVYDGREMCLVRIVYTCIIIIMPQYACASE